MQSTHHQRYSSVQRRSSSSRSTCRNTSLITHHTRDPTSYKREGRHAPPAVLTGAEMEVREDDGDLRPKPFHLSETLSRPFYLVLSLAHALFFSLPLFLRQAAPPAPFSLTHIDIDYGRGAARAEDAQETLTQSDISPSTQMYEDKCTGRKTDLRWAV